MEVKNSLVKKEEKKTFSAFLAQDAMKKKINEMVGGEKGQQFIPVAAATRKRRRTQTLKSGDECAAGYRL